MDMTIVQRTGLASAREPGAGDLARIETLYEAGRLYDAYRATLHLAPMASWRDPEAMIIAARLAHYCGAPRLADALALRAWRRAPKQAITRYYGIRCILTRRGPMAALETLEKTNAPIADPEMRAKWLAQRAQIFGLLRDFGEAEKLIAEARRLAPGHPWIELDAAHILEVQDRCEEALEIVRAVLAAKPLLHSATLATAHLLVQLGRDDEALEFLADAQHSLQSAAICGIAASILTERGRYQEALEAWELCRIYLPMAEPEAKTSLFANLSHLQYLVGNLAESKKAALESGDPLLAKIVERIESNPSQRRRVQHDVPFIRQHHVTCAPTTLAMIGRHWGIDVEHLAIAAEITYGGTTPHDERVWAESNGWRVREFSVTWDAAVTLLDRGMPFTLNTIFVGMGHAQAVIGYDTHRRTLLIRDPSSPGLVEADAEELLARHGAVGPRGMVPVPLEKASLLDGIELPEEHERDLLHRMAAALEAHDRAAAVRELRMLEALAPGGRIALSARHMLAGYDQNVEEALAATDALLALYPGSATLLQQKQSYLLFLGRHRERLELLAEAAKAKDADPVLLRTYADALSNDATDLERAAAAIRRYLRMAPMDAQGLRVQANALWLRQSFRDATRYYRFASCLADTDESLATSYFIAATATGSQDEALALLEDRFARFGDRSGLPAKTLFWALTQLHRLDEAFAVLTKAIDLRPDDGDLLLTAADAYARYGSFEEADRLLARAEKKTREAEYLATLAAVRGYRGELQASLEAWRRVHELQPLFADAHQALRSLLTQLEGRAASRAFCEELVRRFPSYAPARAQLVDELRAGDDDAAIEQAALRLIEEAPHDSWAHRTHAQALAALGRFDEALAACDRAAEIDPIISTNQVVRAQILLRMERHEDAKAALRKAIDLYPDDVMAWTGFIAACTTSAERAADITELFPRAVQRSITGEAIAAAYQVAADVVDGAKLLDMLRDAVAQRPLVAQCRIAYVQQLLRLRKIPLAVTEAEEALQRMPLDVAVRLAAAEAFAAKGDAKRQADALEAALRIDPSSSAAAAALADVLEQQGESDRALAVLRDAAARTPLDAQIQFALGNALWRAGRKDESLERLGRAAALAPESTYIWPLLRERGKEAGRADAASDVAAQLVRDRPRSGEAWLAMAMAEEDLTSRLAAVEQAIAVEPRYETPYHLKAQILAANGRFYDALAACGTLPGYGLRGRAAWVHAERGDLPKAIETMRAVVRDHSDYAWGWHQLAQWYAATNDPRKQLEAANELVRLTPGEAVSWNEVGAAQLALKNGVAAEAAWRRALTLDGANLYAGLHLADLLLDRPDADAAAQVLRELRAHASDPLIALREVSVAVVKQDRDAAASALEKLFEDPEASEELIAEAVRRAYDFLERTRQLTGLVRKFARSPKTLTPAAAATCVTHLGHIGEWGEAIELVDAVRPIEQVNVAAAIAYVQRAAAVGKRKMLDRFLETYDRWAQEDDQLWGMTGFSLRILGDMKRTVTWLSGWQEREHVEPWMLLNLTIALRTLRRDEEAAEITRQALALPVDGASSGHAVWSALDCALAGDVERAQTLMEGIDPDSLDAVHQVVMWIVETVLLGVTASLGAADEYLERIRGLQAGGALQRVFRRYARQAVRTVARRRGGFLAFLWRCYWAANL